MRKAPATRRVAADEPLGFVVAAVGNAAALAFEGALAGESERRLTAGLSAQDQAELRPLLDVVYGNVASGNSQVGPARVW